MSDPDSMPDNPTPGDASDQAQIVAGAEVAPLASDQTFAQAVAAAQAARQQARAAAFATYCWNSGPDFVAYGRALADSDAAYQTAAKAARYAEV